MFYFMQESMKLPETNSVGNKGVEETALYLSFYSSWTLVFISHPKIQHMNQQKLYVTQKIEKKNENVYICTYVESIFSSLFNKTLHTFFPFLYFFTTFLSSFVFKHHITFMGRKCMYTCIHLYMHCCMQCGLVSFTKKWEWRELIRMCIIKQNRKIS